MLYILPYIYQGMKKIEMVDVVEALSTHQQLIDILGEKNKWIPEFNYSYEVGISEKMIENEEEYYLAGKIIDLASEFKADIVQIIAREIQDVNYIIKRNLEEDKQFENKKEWNKECSALGKIKSKDGELPILKINNVDELFGCYNIRKKLKIQYEWIFDLIDFTIALTESYSKLKAEFFKPVSELTDNRMNLIDYFIFNDKGRMVYFIGFNAVEVLSEWSLPHGYDFILANNIKVFKTIIKEIMKEIYKDPSDFNNQQTNSTKAVYLNPLYILHGSLDNIFNMEDLKNIRQALLKQEYWKDERVKKKIGIFMDTANIYTPLKNIEINFDKLIAQVYGIESGKCTIYKYCTLFWPYYKNTKIQEFVNKKKKKQEKELKEYGFEVHKIEGKSDKANQEDDEKLKKLLESHKYDIQEAIILTGDVHFLEYFKAYEDMGIMLKIISLEESSTSQKILKMFKQHHFLYEFWEAISLWKN